MGDASKRVSIRLSVDGAQQAKQELREVGEQGQRSLERIKDGSDRASRALALIDFGSRSAGAAAFASGLAAVARAGDRMAQSLAKLQNATGSVERASAVYEQLYRNALQTGVSVAESADSFQRFSIAAREIGATNDEVVRLVAGLQRVAIVSGATGGEISAVTAQLAQALASGVLQGDELRSVMENMPLLAEALSKELGVAIGELRKLGEEGKLTADRVFPALLRATKKLGADLDKMPPSLSRGMGQLTAATSNFLGQLDQAIGLSNALARGLSAAARAIDGIRRGGGLLTEGEKLADMKRQADALGKQLGTLEAGIDTTRNRGTLRPPLTDEDRKRRIEEVRRQYFELQAEIEEQEKKVAARAGEERAAADQAAAEGRRRRAEAEVGELRRQLDDRFRINQEYEEKVKKLRSAKEAGGVDAAEATRLETLALKDRGEALKRLEPRVERATSMRRAATPVIRDNKDATRELNELLRERERLIQDNETAYERYQRRMERLSDLMERSEKAGRPVPDVTVQREAERAMEDLENAKKRIGAAAEKANETVRDLGLTFGSAFEDAIVKDEKLSSVMEGLLQDIARVIARRTITEPLADATSSALKGMSFDSMFSGVGNWIGGLFRAEGGPVGAGKPYIVGERGPEWFVPDRSGTVLPNGMPPLGGPTVHNSISIDARGADAGVEARLRLMANQIARQASAMTLDAVRRGGAAYDTVRG